MKILVTGSAGFINGYVIGELLAAGHTVVGIDNGFGAACAIARMFTWPNR